MPRKGAVSCPSLTAFFPRLRTSELLSQRPHSELAVLRGLGRLLGQVGAIWLEVSNAEMYRGQPLRAEVEAFMSQHGFQLAVNAVRHKPQGDQLWVRS